MHEATPSHGSLTRTLRILVAALAAPAFQMPVALAQVAPVGPEIQVNSYTPGNQVWPAVAASPAGDFVVVWTSDGSTASDTDIGISAHSASARMALRSAASFRSTATRQAGSSTERSPRTTKGDSSWPGRAMVRVARTPRSGAFRPNASTPPEIRWAASSRSTPTRLATSPIPRSPRTPRAGSVVVWDSVGSDGTDASEWQYPGPEIRLLGTPVGLQFQVNCYTSSAQVRPARGLRRARKVPRRLGELRFERSGYELVEHPGPAFRRRRQSDRERLPGEHLYDSLPIPAVRRRCGPRGFRRQLGQLGFLRHRYELEEHSGAALRPRWKSERGRVPGERGDHERTDPAGGRHDARRQLRRRLAELGIRGLGFELLTVFRRSGSTPLGRGPADSSRSTATRRTTRTAPH